MVIFIQLTKQTANAYIPPYSDIKLTKTKIKMPYIVFCVYDIR